MHSDPSGKYLPGASHKTRRLIDRLSRKVTEGIRQDVSVMEEILTSLQTDQFVIRALKDALEKSRMQGLSQDLINKCIKRCKELEIECDVIGASTAIRCGLTGHALRLLNRIGELDVESIPEVLRPILFHMFLSMAWAGVDTANVEMYVNIAGSLDIEKRFTEYLINIGHLLKARVELESGNPDIAVRISQRMDRNLKPDDPLRALAFEIRADAFHHLCDQNRELAALEDWLDLSKHMPNGPCDLAVLAESVETAPGVTGGARSEEILTRYSQLAHLYEQEPDTRPFSRKIYQHFLNTAYHKWIDKGLTGAGTIEKRLAGLEDVRAGKPSAHVPGAGSIAVFEPARSFGRISDLAVEELLADLEATPAASSCAVIIDYVEMRERRFSFEPGRGSSLVQLLSSFQEICTYDHATSVRFTVNKAAVLWKSHSEDWFILSHETTATDIQNISFGIRVVTVGDEFDLSVFALFSYTPPLDDSAKISLADLLKHKPAEWGGYGALKARALDLIKAAGRRVGQQRGGGTSGGEVEGGFQWLT